uniref:Clathrin assembly protein n=1 Tax=Parastrongyloides trichosuri TaxID=131310 RepID=A0A0N4ZAI9_PARTI
MDFNESIKIITKLRENHHKEDALDEFEKVNISLLPSYNTKVLLIYCHYLSNFAITKSLQSTSYIRKKRTWKCIRRLLNDIYDVIDKVEIYEEKFNILLMICNICSFYKEFDDDLLVESCYEYAYMLRMEIKNPKNGNLFSKKRVDEMMEFFDNIEHTFIMRNQKNNDEDNKDTNPILCRSKTLNMNGFEKESMLWRNGSIDQAIVQKKIHNKKIYRKNTLINCDMFNDPDAPAAQLIKKRVQEVEDDIDNVFSENDCNEIYSSNESINSNENDDIKNCIAKMVDSVVEGDSLFVDGSNNNSGNKRNTLLQNFRQDALDESDVECLPNDIVNHNVIKLSDSFLETLSKNAGSSRRRTRLTLASEDLQI